MLTYLSFAYRTMHEQQLLSSRAIARYLYDYSAGIIDDCPETQFTGVLSDSKLDFLPDGCPQTKLTVLERTKAETRAIHSLDSVPRNRWVVVLRPAQGYVSPDRLESFCRALGKIPEDDRIRETGAYATSIIRHSTLTHPCWNLRAAPRHLFCDNGIRVSLEESVMRDTLEQACPELWEDLKASKVHRSQDALPLLHGDDALYAFFVGTKEIGDVPDLPERPVLHADDNGADVPLFYRLPTFTMSRHQCIDVAPLERLVLREGAPRPRTRPVRPARREANMTAVAG